MLDIDYSNPRKFLMSAGINMIFLGALIWLSGNIILFKEHKALLDVLNTEELAQVFLSQLNRVAWFAIILAVGGFIFFLIGFFRWKKNGWKD